MGERGRQIFCLVYCGGGADRTRIMLELVVDLQKVADSIPGTHWKRLRSMIKLCTIMC